MADTRDSIDLVKHAEETDVLETSLTESFGVDPERIGTSLEFMDDSGTASPGDDPDKYQVTTPTPVYYTGVHGAVFIQTENRVLEKADGSKVIVTPETPQGADERPIQKKDLRFLKIFSVISILLFPPTGVAALICAFKTESCFYEGVERGDLTLAQKYSRRCERLLVMSLVLGLLMYCIIVAIVEKVVLGEDYTPMRSTFGHNTP